MSRSSIYQSINHPEIHVIRCMLNSLINVTKCPVKSKCKPPFKKIVLLFVSAGVGVTVFASLREL